MEKDVRRYELSYHLLPTLTPELALEDALALRKSLETFGAKIVDEGEAKMTELSYPIAKTIDTKRNWFSQSYFGWMQFEISTEEAAKALLAFEKSAATVKGLLRMLLIVAEKEEAPAKRVVRAEENPLESAPIESLTA